MSNAQRARVKDRNGILHSARIHRTNVAIESPNKAEHKAREMMYEAVMVNILVEGVEVQGARARPVPYYLSDL
jgi:hypothetical protein